MLLGLGVSEDLPVAVQQRLAVDVEAAGFASLWTNEANGRDALLLCQAWAAVTTRLRVGVGVVPLWTRTPAQLAMASATLQEASGGRFLLGLGVAHPSTMTGWHGVAYRRPLTAARETLAILDQLAAGARSDLAGRVQSSRRFKLAVTPRPEPAPRLLAAMGPRMLALAGTDADGTLLNWSGPAEVARACGIVRDAARGGRPAPHVAAYVRFAVAEDRGAAAAALAEQASRYALQPAYADHFARQGLGDAIGRLRRAQEAGADAAGKAEALGDAALAVVGWHGTPADDPRSVLDAYRDAGLDELVARVVVVGDDAVDGVHRVVRALAV